MFLHFGDLYQKAHTKHVSLEVLAPNNDAAVLEGLRELTLRRDQAVGRECMKLETSKCEHHAESFIKYLGLLSQLLRKVKEESWDGELSAGAAKAGFLWSSPLSTLPPTAHFSLTHWLLEEIMALYFYAALLQEQAFQICTELQAEKRSGEEGGSSGGGEDGGHVKAAALFRKAAGAYKHIRDQLLPAAALHIPADPPIELSAAAAELLETTALAQAQGVAAHRAEMKGVSPAAMAAVHCGAAELFEAAAAKARGMAQGRPPSQRLRRYLAVSSELHAAKTLRALAVGRMAEGKAGKASACLRDGMAKLRQCLSVADKDVGWRPPLMAELKKSEAVDAMYERERVLVYVESVAGAAETLPDGKVVVATTAWKAPHCSDHFFI